MSITYLTDEQLEGIVGGANDSGPNNTNSLVGYLDTQPADKSTTSITNPQGSTVGFHSIPAGLANHVASI